MCDFLVDFPDPYMKNGYESFSTFGRTIMDTYEKI